MSNGETISADTCCLEVAPPSVDVYSAGSATTHARAFTNGRTDDRSMSGGPQLEGVDEGPSGLKEIQRRDVICVCNHRRGAWFNSHCGRREFLCDVCTPVWRRSTSRGRETIKKSIIRFVHHFNLLHLLLGHRCEGILCPQLIRERHRGGLAEYRPVLGLAATAGTYDSVHVHSGVKHAVVRASCVGDGIAVGVSVAAEPRDDLCTRDR